MQGVVANRPCVTMSFLERQKGGEGGGVAVALNAFAWGGIQERKFLPALRSLKLNAVCAWEIGLL